MRAADSISIRDTALSELAGGGKFTAVLPRVTPYSAVFSNNNIIVVNTSIQCPNLMAYKGQCHNIIIMHS